MATITGTHDISSLLAVKHQSAVEFGEDTIAQVLQADLDAHNRIMADMLGELVDRTTDRQRISGTSLNGDMIETDEYGRVPTQKATPGQTVGFPMRKYAYALGWTRDFLKVATPADLAVGALAAQKAHRKAVAREIRRSLYLATNYSFYDFLIDNVTLAVKRLINADSSEIPEGPNGETFDGSTHTHYQARASTLANSDVDALVADVLEHGHGGALRIVISTSNVAAISALTGFTPLTAPMVIPPLDDPRTVRTLDPTRADNRLIGYWAGAYEVWTKPWAIANYYLCYDASDARKPLAMRERPQASLRGLRLAAEIDLYPLRAQYMEVEFGLGVWNRTNGAVLYTGATSWADPAIA